MKIPDLAEVSGNESSKKPKHIDLGKARKKKAKSSHLIRLIVILIAVLVLAFVWLNASTIFEPLRGIASKVETKTSTDVGFPIKLPGSSDYSLMRLSDSFSLLTDTYLYSYDTNGAQLYALKHGYSHPEQATSDKRIMLYDKTGYNFTVFSRSSLIYKKAVEDKIVFTSIGNDGLAAVVTESDRYSNVMYVYDDGGNWLYTRKFADENVMQVQSVGDGEHIIVSTLSAFKGDLAANYYKFSLKDSTGQVWKYTMVTNSLPIGLYADKDTVISVCDNKAAAINCSDGKLRGSCDIAGSLKGFSAGADMTLIHYTDISTNRNIVMAIDGNAEEISLTTVSGAASCVYCDENGIYILDGTKMKVYDRDLLNEKFVPAADDDYISFVKIDNNVYMLGYDTINTLDVTK